MKASLFTTYFGTAVDLRLLLGKYAVIARLIATAAERNRLENIFIPAVMFWDERGMDQILACSEQPSVRDI